jgi:cytidylate kinase
MITKTHNIPDPGLSRAVEKQLRRWEIASAQHPLTTSGTPRETLEFIALSNAVGAGGDELAAALGHRLNWPIFDREILQAMADNDDVRVRLYHSMDERDLGWFEETFRSLMQQEFRKNDYFHRLTETILFLARRGPAIFLGRGVDLILSGNQGLRVKVTASHQRRVENFAKRMNTTLNQASAEIERIEQDRRDFFQKHFHADADDCTRFDLVINVERFATEQAVELILAALKMHR